MLKVANVLTSVSRAGGGITEVARALTLHLSKTNVEVQTFGLRDDWSDADVAAWQPSVVKTFKAMGPRAFGFAPGLKRGVSDLKPDVLHCHGLWMYPSIVSRRMSGPKLPEVVSPHGMLDPWAVTNSAWKKRIARLLFEDSHLKGASCLHALGTRELEAIRALYPNCPVCVIPNGIDLSDDSAYATNEPQGKKPAMHKRVLLHLGRIHPKKGLTNLVSAWAAARKDHKGRADEWSLVIAGWEGSGPSYAEQLRQQAVACGVADSVSFPGPLFGAEKTSALRSANAFVLASISEGMPMTVLEAWGHRLPVIMTPECNIPEGFAAGAALRVSPDRQSLQEGLAELFSMTDAERRGMGEAGRKLVQQRFTWDLAAERLAAVYGWLLGGPRPDSVDLPP